jgi:hypothetical protein
VLYKRVCEYLELDLRVEVLNTRFMVLQVGRLVWGGGRSRGPAWVRGGVNKLAKVCGVARRGWGAGRCASWAGECVPPVPQYRGQDEGL